MAVSPAYAENLSGPVVELYAEAELTMLRLIARHLAAGADAPDWAERKLLEVQLINARLRGEVDTLNAQSADRLASALAKAYNRGQAGAITDLDSIVDAATDHVTGLPSINRLLAETTAQVTATHGRILRVVPDLYRTVVREASGQVLVGTETRRQAAQRALNRLTSKGITGFVDRAGRGWDLASYVETATRTATGRAAVDGHTDRLQAAGHDLVIVSNAPQECETCRPFEGRVLSLSGAPVVGVDVYDTLAGARGRGLFHPNCRHSTALFQPGVTKAPTDTADPQGDQDRQQLRYLERQVRQWKRRQAVALDDAASRQAGARVRDYQARIRAHVSSTSAKRQPGREQLGAR